MKKIISKVFPKRGEIYLVNFDPTIGSEIKKTRPALIIQNDISNQYSPVTIVSAISSFETEEKIYPNEIHISIKESGLPKNSIVLLNQIRTIDKERLIKKIGQLNNQKMFRIDIALKISLNIDNLNNF